MKSSKILDISKSSLVSLKAELLRKQEEVKKVKAQEENKFIHCVPKPLKKTVHTKSNQGVEARNEKDIQENEEDVDIHAKSREMLEAKTRLYDKLKEGTHTVEGKPKYLVDFQKKHIEEGDAKSSEINENDSDDETRLSDTSDPPSDPEDDWVDFVDALGRTRRCLRRDLPYMKSKDADLQKSIQPKPPNPPPLPESDAEEPQLELFSADMHRAAMRQKWEEQEMKLRDKTDIHYQDILFDVEDKMGEESSSNKMKRAKVDIDTPTTEEDNPSEDKEARTHGVGYFNFSAEEEERLRQQDSLNKMRQDTTRQQTEVKASRDRRQQQMAARLQAARKRRRERLGLPPEEEEDQEIIAVEVVEDQPKQEERIEDIEETLKRAAHVRPWDIGKDGVITPEVMSQEEWVEKKREERPEEFAPPSYPEEPTLHNFPSKRNKPNLFFTSKKARVSNTEVEPSVPVECDDVWSSNDSAKELPVNPLRRGAEVPPPASMEYFGGSSKPKHVPHQKQDIADSISAGLEYLRKQVEDKEKKSRKDFFEVM